MGSKHSKGASAVTWDEERQDELFDALSHPYRRFALLHLQTVETPLSVEALAAELDEWDGRRHATERPDADPSALEVALVHNHLPRLADAGLLGYDHSQRTVTRTDRTEEVQSHL